MERKRDALLSVGKTVLGCALFGLGFNLFLEPNGLSAGGVSGLSMVFVQVTKLAREPFRQYDLFSGITPTQYERKLRLDETVDSIRDKFGEDIIRRAKFTRDPNGHMAGGLSKARRTGVTKPIPKEF